MKLKTSLMKLNSLVNGVQNLVNEAQNLVNGVHGASSVAASFPQGTEPPAFGLRPPASFKWAIAF